MHIAHRHCDEKNCRYSPHRLKNNCPYAASGATGVVENSSHRKFIPTRSSTG